MILEYIKENKKIKEMIMNANSIEDLMKIESKLFEQFRNNFYNQLLKDNEVKKHICEIFKVVENVIQNVLMINRYHLLDNF